MTSIADEAIRLKQKAHAGPIGKRHSSFALYELLGECMSLAERCRQNPVEFAELERLVREAPTAGKGRWGLKDSDEYILVCRFVFPRSGKGKGELSNASRYAMCMREASKQKIPSSGLAEHLKTKGGLNSLYLARPLSRTTVETKTLRLTKPIEVPKSGEITLTLRRMPDGSFEVVHLERESTLRLVASN